jgi:DNA polymerase elongation subunit (family B)
MIEHINQHEWSAREIRKRSLWKCEHRQDGLNHASCYNTAHNIIERVCFLDTEFHVGKNNWGRLAGDWGIFFCWVIRDANGNEWYDCIKSDEVFKAQADKRIIKSCISRLLHFDRIITQYGDRADIPLLRTRALINRLPFPPHGRLFSTDVYKIAKDKLCLSSNSQKIISLSLHGKTEKTAVESKIWQAANRGHEPSLKKILRHCRADVRDLERNAISLLPFIKQTRRSI